MNFSLRHFAEIMVVLLTAAIVVVFILLIPALKRISTESADGAAARQRQCDTLPAAKKELADFRRRRVINDKDVAKFRSTEPQGCN